MCSKIFGKVSLDSIHEFSHENFFLNSSQFVFLPNDPSIHQPIAITHDIFTVCDANASLVVCGTILDLSKTFDRAWHEGRLITSNVME